MKYKSAGSRRRAQRATATSKKPYPKAKPTVKKANPNPRGNATRSTTTSATSKGTNPRARAAANRGSVNTATNRNFDAAPGGTNPNPRARNQSLRNDVTGGVKTKAGTYKTYKKNSAAAKSFRSAFSAAKKKGYKTFTWNGKKYNTKTK